MAPAEITFQDHLKELRKRFMWIILAVGISAGLGYVLRDPIIAILQKPLGAPLYYTSPAGSFNFVLKIAFVIGLFIALPVLIYHLLMFIEPALPMKLKKGTFIKVIGSSFLLATAGMAFGFFLMVPMSLKFFLGYSTASIKPLITADEYLSFVLNHLITFALAFQIPMIFLFINRIKPLQPQTLLKYQRHVVVGSFALAIILPFTYDPLSQFIVAIPIIVLYYLSIALIWIANRKKPKAPPKAVASEPVRPILPPAPALTPSPSPAWHPALPASPAATLRLRSIDGFMVRPKSSVQPPAQPTMAATITTPSISAPAPRPVAAPIKPKSSLGGPHLSIDGFVV